MPGKGQTHRQEENTGHVADLVLKTKSVWLGGTRQTHGKGGKGRGEQKYDFCDSKVAAVSHSLEWCCGKGW